MYGLKYGLQWHDVDNDSHRLHLRKSCKWHNHTRLKLQISTCKLRRDHALCFCMFSDWVPFYKLAIQLNLKPLDKQIVQVVWRNSTKYYQEIGRSEVEQSSYSRVHIKWEKLFSWPAV